MLLDTGSSNTIIPYELFLQCKGNRESVSETVSLQTASGEYMNLHGQCYMPIKIGDYQLYTNVVISKAREKVPPLLGTDILSQIPSLNIQLSEGQLVTQVSTVQMLRNPKMLGCCYVYAKANVNIPPRSEINISVVMDKPIFGKTPPEVVIEPINAHLAEQNLLAASCLVKSRKKTIPVRLINPTECTIHVKKDTLVGYSSPVKRKSTSDVKGHVPEKPKVAITDDMIQAKIDGLPDYLKSLFDDMSHLSMEEKYKYVELINLNKDVFQDPEGPLGYTDLAEHTIDTGTEKPVKERLRRADIGKRKIVEDETEKMLKAGVIEPSTSPWASPIVLVTKKDGTVRFCVDYRRLNAITKCDAYPLPRIDDTLDALSGMKFFSTLDCQSGYWQLKLADSDKEKSAFITHQGLFQFAVMPFGLSNAPATFERLMDRVLAGLLWERALVYLDDVIVYGRTFDEALENLAMVFQRYRNANLKLKGKKCDFFKLSINFLGHVISEAGVACDPDKLSAVKEWPVPTNQKELRGFYGLCSYYRRFVPMFAEVTDPLAQMMGKKSNFAWNEEAQKSFDTMKQLLCEPPVLALPNDTSNFILDCDASDQSIGAVLSIVVDDEEKVIAYASKALNKAQRQYCVTKKELLAVVTFLQKFKHYLRGRAIIVRSDHSSLQWLLRFKEPEGLLARWLTILSQYNFSIVHRPGNLHANADALSRRPIRTKRNCNRVDCSDCQLFPIKDKKVAKVLCTQEVIEPTEVILPHWSTEYRRESQIKDSDIQPILAWKESGAPKPSRDEIIGYSAKTKTLWAQYDSLFIEDGVL